MLRKGAMLVLLLGSGIAGAQPATDAGGRNETGLLGARLAPIDDAAGLVVDLIFSTRKGTIPSATVVDDTARSLVVEVDFTGLPTGGRRLRATVQDAAGKDLASFEAAPVAVTGNAGKARLAIGLRSGLAEGFTIESARLRVEARKDNAVQYDTDRVFALPRRWTTAVRPENVIVDATPTPVGSVPGAKVAPTVPPMLFKPELLPRLKMAPVAVTPVARGGPSPAGSGGGGPQPMRLAAQPMSAATAFAATAPPATAILAPAVMERRTLTLAAAPDLAHDPKLKRLPQLKRLDEASGLPPTVVDKNGKGPSRNPLPWFDSIRAPPGLQLTAANLTTIDSTVFQDANPASGIWYYLPARYVVAWDPDNGHALRITYGTAVGDKQPVYVSARLTAGIDAAEISLVRNLLRAQLTAAGVPFTELRPLPFRDAPQVSFKGQLGQFDVPPEKVAVNAISDIAGEMDVSIATDPVTTAVLQATLTEGLGLPGSATFVAAGADSFARTIPVVLRAPDVRSYGGVPWRRGVLLRNRTPFPMLVRHLHFLTVAPDGQPTVYSYAFEDVIVPAQAQLRVIDAAIPAWLDRELKAWIVYAVRESDEAGQRAIRDEIGMDAAQSTAQVSLSTLTPFAGGGLARLVVDVRSRYFDPKDRAPQVRSHAFSKDDDSAAIGPLFLGDRGPDELLRAGDPLFSWRLTAVKTDGAACGPGAWTDGARLDLYFGQTQVQAVGCR